jgi:SAM-dependent methyltransferase
MNEEPNYKEDLKYMWNRWSESFLATYLKSGEHHPFFSPQHFLVRDLILKEVAAAKGTPEVSTDWIADHTLALFGRFLPSFNPDGVFFSAWLYPLLRSVWQTKLQHLSNEHSLRLLDIGCGSGNYYEGFVMSDLARFIDYTGIDIAEGNIENCRTLYPERNWIVGDICALSVPSQSFDIVLVSRVFEYLPIEQLAKAANEVTRVTKKKAIINFFLERDIPAHQVRKVMRYHRNCLSRRVLMRLFRGFSRITIHDTYDPFWPKRKIEYTDGLNNPMVLSTWVLEK